MTANQATSVRFGRLERRGLLVGLTGAQLALLGSALVIVVAAALAAGPGGVLLSAPAWAATSAWALVPVGGRPAVEATPTASAWLSRRISGTSTVLARPRLQSDRDLVEVPGLPGSLRIGVDERTGAALVRSARGAGPGTVTAVAQVRGRGFLLADAGAQDRLVAGWGRLLASLAQVPGVAGVQVLHRCAPSGAQEIRAWWERQTPTSTGWARGVVTDLMSEIPNGTRVQVLIAVAIRPGRGKGTDAVLGALSDAITAADLDLQSWLTPDQIRRVIREPYDPAPALLGVDAGATVACGPMGVAESWAHVRTDSAVHAVYWVSEWPRSDTHPSFLRPVLLAPGSRRTLSLLATPLPPAKALREIRRARAEQTADAMTRARVGRVVDEVSRAAASELDRREEDLVAGHGDLRFLGLLAISAPTLDELSEECAAAETAAAQAGCELRRLVGQQVQGFAAAALPLARVLP